MVWTFFFATDFINFLAFLYRDEEIYGRRSADSDWQKPSRLNRFISASSSWTSHFAYLHKMFSIYLCFFVNWFNRRYCFYWFVVWQSIGFNRGCVNRTGFGWWFCFSGKFSTMLPNNACFYIKVFLYWSWVFFFRKIMIVLQLSITHSVSNSSRFQQSQCSLNQTTCSVQTRFVPIC